MSFDRSAIARAYMKVTLFGAIFVTTLVLQVFAMNLLAPELVDAISAVPLALTSGLATWASRRWVDRRVR
jgi:hypothetical protein